MRVLAVALVLLLLVIEVGHGGAQSLCGCAEPEPIAHCTAATRAPRTFAEVFGSIGALEGRVVTVRATLHRFYACTARMMPSGLEETCVGQAALIERRGREERVIYLGGAQTDGPYGCSGTTECACCRVDVRDQVVVVTGIVHSTPVRRIESPILCSAY